jgi:hypothetical protein
LRRSFLFFFYGGDERKRNQLVSMELRLLKGLNGTERHTVMVGLKHDPLAHRALELEYTHKRFYHVVDAVHVVVMEQDFVTRNVGGILLKDSAGFG